MLEFVLVLGQQGLRALEARSGFVQLLQSGMGARLFQQSEEPKTPGLVGGGQVRRQGRS